MKHSRLILLLALAALVAGAGDDAAAQRRFRPIPTQIDRNGTPTWEVDPEMPDELFTFVRLRYRSQWRGHAWATDYPDADLNLSYRLQQLTSMRAHPDGKIVDIEDPTLFDHPWAYMIEPGDIDLAPSEAETLRRYMESGGFVMVDDFWGEDEWFGFYQDLKQVFPDREPEELPLEHPIFHCVYDLKEKPQVPSIGHAMSGYHTERWDAREAHYRAVLDDDGRIMMMICHNTDLGDGWEREGENEDYFHQFSERWAYPMGINIVFYAMTH